jgi:hypothetical protein
MRLSVFRKYTFAALKAFGALTVPAALANPATSETFFGFACAKLKSASETNSAAQHAKRRLTQGNLLFTAFLPDRIRFTSYIIIYEKTGCKAATK